MKKLTINLLLIFIVFGCSKQKEYPNNFIGTTWENQDLQSIAFDSSIVIIPLKGMDPLRAVFHFEMVDTNVIQIVNKALNTSNIIEFKDSLSIIKIERSNADSILLIPLNRGAKELLMPYSNLKFYNVDRADRGMYYVEKDSECKKAIDSALSDIKNGKHVLGLYMRPLGRRQGKEFIKVLSEAGIEYYDRGPAPDELPVKRDCYFETMDYRLKKKFGKNYLIRFLSAADSLMILNARNRIFQYYECDTVPHPVGEIPDSYQTIYIIAKDINIKVAPIKYPHKPFIDLAFEIDTNSNLSNFKINSFNPEDKWNVKFKNDFFSLGVNAIKAKKWTPGVILGKKVNAENIVRVFYEKE